MDMANDALVDLWRAKKVRDEPQARPYQVAPEALQSIKISCGAPAVFAAFYGIDISKNEVIKTREQILDEIAAMHPQDAQELLWHYINCSVGPEQINVFDMSK